MNRDVYRLALVGLMRERERLISELNLLGTLGLSVPDTLRLIRDRIRWLDEEANRTIVRGAAEMQMKPEDFRKELMEQ